VADARISEFCAKEIIPGITGEGQRRVTCCSFKRSETLHKISSKVLFKAFHFPLLTLSSKSRNSCNDQSVSSCLQFTCRGNIPR
jgi:hypothetical protein